MSNYTIRPLDSESWDAFASLAEKHNGVWGGCWCTWFLPASDEEKVSVGGSRAYKELMVREGKTHHALVFDGEAAVAWCEYGPPEELPNMKHRKEYEAKLDRLPDYRITCFFVDRDYRRKGLASMALGGALDLIAKAGGGLVESYPHETPDKKTSASFLYNGTRPMFERAGFDYVRPKGTKNCLVRKTVSPA